MRSEAARFRSFRKRWWLRPMVILPTLALILLSVPMYLWIHSYGSVAADSMFVITYAALVVWQVILTKGTISEPHIRVNQAEVAKEKESIRAERRRKREAIYSTEVSNLKGGGRTTVLDVWKLDESIRSRHPFIEYLAVSEIDPVASEWLIRLHLPDDWTFANGSDQPDRIRRLTRSFLRLLALEPDAAIFRPFATRLCLVVFKSVDDNSLTGSFVPVLSIMVTLSELITWAELPPTTAGVGNMVFDAGSEIKPHRVISSVAASGK